VLWLLLLLSIIAGVMLVEARSERRLAAAGVAVIDSRLVADAAINRAIMSLVNAQDPERWRLDGTPRRLRVLDRDVEVWIESESGKIDLNASRADLLAALFRSQGVAPAEADQLADRAVAWRSPLRPGTPDDAADPYRAAGRSYGPRHAPFRSVDELRLVLGMTDELQRSVTPALTVYARTSDVDRQVAGDPVLRALAEAGDKLADAQRAARELDQASGIDRRPEMGEALNISARVTRDQVVVTRTAVLRLTGDRRQPCWVLAWH
jgi:general secretion pathway protein K